MILFPAKHSTPTLRRLRPPDNGTRLQLELLEPRCLLAFETETFDAAQSAADAGWTAANLPHGGNDFGVRASTLAGGPAGELAGIVARSPAVSYFADVTIHKGSERLDANDVLVASGTIALNDINFNGGFGVGWFNQSSAGGAFHPRYIGMSFAEASGGVRVYAGHGLGGTWDEGTSAPQFRSNGAYSWRIEYDPLSAQGGDGRVTVMFGGLTPYQSVILS